MARSTTSLEPFSPSTESWDLFLQRFEMHLIANDLNALPDVRKKAYFLDACGKEMFATARALAAPQTLSTITWDDLLQKLRNHYAPTPSKYARRFSFRHLVQAEGVGINQYVASLRAAALECDFSDLDEALLEQILYGVRDLGLQRRLLGKKDLTLAVVLDDARAAEISTASAAEIQRNQLQRSSAAPVHLTDCDPSIIAAAEGTVNRMRTAGHPRRTPSQPMPLQNHRPPIPQNPQPSPFQQRRPAMPPCDSCGEPHPRRTCRFLSAICHRCGKRGHLEKVCRSTDRRASGGHRPYRDSCFAIRPDEFAPEEEVEEVFLSSGGGRKKISITVSLEGAPLTMEVDTGSSRTLVSWQTLKHILPTFSKDRLTPSNVLLRDYQGTSIPIRGQASVFVTKGEFAGMLPVVVVSNPLPSLLGLDWFPPRDCLFLVCM